MGINAQATQVGTGRPVVSTVTMWIMMAVVVVSLLTVGAAMALRGDPIAPAREGAPRVTQEAPDVVRTGGSGGYVLETGSICHQCR